MKRAQSALEYLMTYGWAILIIIIVASALYAMGVFNPAAWSGKRVMGLSYFQVEDWKYDTSGDFTQVLGNKYGRPINITGLSADCAGTVGAINPDVIVAPNQETTITVTGLPVLPEGSAIECEVAINYTDTTTTLTHADYGTYSGPVETP